MSKVAEIVTEQIIEALDRGVVPWRRPWSTRGQDIARNAWGKAYRGVNVWLLAGSRMANEFNSNTWLTFNQVAAQGGTVLPGSKSTLVVFWKSGVSKDLDEKTGKPKKFFMLRYFRVFNLDQTHDVKLTASQQRAEDARVTSESTILNPIEDAEAIVGSYFVRDDAPRLTEGSDRASYLPIDDIIVVPARDQYESNDEVAPEFYSTLFHEIGHSTGHAKRLNREGVANFDHFGTGQYAAEELVAEFTSAFLCAEAGIDNTIANSAAYIANWKSRLQDDPNLIIAASGKAQKALDYVLGVDPSAQQEDAE